VDHRVGAQAGQRREVAAQVGGDECEPRIALVGGESRGIALDIEGDHTTTLREQQVDDVRADEAGGPGDEHRLCAIDHRLVRPSTVIAIGHR
jgi:hypothetical protein